MKELISIDTLERNLMKTMQFKEEVLNRFIFIMRLAKCPPCMMLRLGCFFKFIAYIKMVKYLSVFMSLDVFNIFIIIADRSNWMKNNFCINLII